MTAKRNLVLILVGVAVLAALVVAFMPRPVAVDVATASRGDFTVTVEEEGKTRVIDRFVVSAPVAGFARRVELDVGDQVEKGDRLMSLEPLRSDVLDPRSGRPATSVTVTKNSLSPRARHLSMVPRQRISSSWWAMIETTFMSASCKGYSAIHASRCSRTKASSFRSG